MESIIVRAAHEISALFAGELAFALGQAAAAHRAVQHRFLFGNTCGSFKSRRFRIKLHWETIIMKAE